MTDTNDNKKKRNKPCENCRAHRRKCNITVDGRCDRCLKMNLTCLFKFTTKPTVIKKNVPTSKKAKMLDQVYLMQQSIAEMEEQLKALQVCMDLKKSPPPSRQSKKVKFEPDTQDQWQLTITQTTRGLCYQTSIKSVSDMISFLTKTLNCFSCTYEPLHTPNYHIDLSTQKVKITIRLLLVERVIHGFFQEPKQRPLIACSSQHNKEVPLQFKKQMINAYFDCDALITPTFTPPWFRQFFVDRPDSLFSSSVAAFMTLTRCVHVTDAPPCYSHQELADSFLQDAKDRLQATLLEEGPSVFTAASLMILARCDMIVLENRKARFHSRLALQMILDIRHTYLPILSQIKSSTPVTQEIAMAESFRRTFYSIRYLENNLNLTYMSVDYSNTLYNYGFGLPVVLENEKDIVPVKQSIDAFRYSVILHVFQMSSQSENLELQLLAGSLDSICIADIAHIENQLFQFWKSLPPEFRISEAPLAYVDEERIENLENPYAIFLNHLFYSYLLILETRLMQKPSSTNMMSVPLDRFDSERSTLLVSIGCDALAKISDVQIKRLPCTIELHRVMIASDAMTLLQTSQNTYIRERAEANLRTTLNVLEKRMQQRASPQEINKETVDYFFEFKKALYSCFENED